MPGETKKNISKIYIIIQIYKISCLQFLGNLSNFFRGIHQFYMTHTDKKITVPPFFNFLHLCSVIQETGNKYTFIKAFSMTYLRNSLDK